MTRSEGGGWFSTKMSVALNLHQSNQLNAAQAIYEEILRANQLDAELLNLYGTLLHQQGLSDVALKFLKKAIILSPKKALFYNRLGAGLQAIQANQKSVLAYSRATVIDSDLFEAYLNLASLLLKLDDINAALDAARRAVLLNSGSWVARLRLGAILQSMNKFDLAISELNLASMQNPLALEPYFSLCQIHFKLKNYKDGLTITKKGLVLAPERFDFYPHLHGAYLITQPPPYPQMLRWAERGVIIRATDSAFWYLLSLEYQRHNLQSKFLNSAIRAVLLNPQASEFYHSLSASFQLIGKLEQAFYVSWIVSIVFPKSAPNRHIMWETLFAMGKQKEAWKYWLNRFENADIPPRIGLPVNKWRPEIKYAKKILVCSEQGIGDEILYLSCLPDLIKDQPELAVECDFRWQKLFQRSFPAIEFIPRQTSVGKAEEILYDYREVVRRHNIEGYILNGDLPPFYRQDLNVKRKTDGYLRADPNQIKKYTDILNKITQKTLIGICWRSAFTEPVPFVYAKVDELISSLPNGDYSLINLQYGDFEDEIIRIGSEHGVIIHQIPDLDQIEDLDGVAALMSCLDLVIAPSSSVLHLACALGVPTISTYYPNFRFKADTDPLFGNCLPMLNPEEVFSSSEVASRTGATVQHFMRFGQLPLND